MIEHEELGLKIAENEEEAFWETIRKSAEDTINKIPEILKKLKDEEKLNLAIKEMAENKLKSSNRNI